MTRDLIACGAKRVPVRQLIKHGRGDLFFTGCFVQDWRSVSRETFSRLTALLHVTTSFRELSDKKLLSQAGADAFGCADCKIAEH